MKISIEEVQAVMAVNKRHFLGEVMRPGEVYAGLLLGVDGARDAHIFIPPISTTGTWDHCMEWASEQGFFLPTRREQSLLIANAKALFDGKWHWSCEQHAGSSAGAWYQLFDDGGQHYCRKSTVGHARPVRRLEI